MTPPPKTTGARWIIVTPSPDDEAWRQAIRDGLFSAGLAVEPYDPTTYPSLANDPGMIIYAQDAAVAVAAGARTVTAIIPDPIAAIAAVRMIYKTAPTESILIASRLLAAAAAMPPEHRVIGAEQLRSLTGPLKIFPDVSILPPVSIPTVFATEAERAVSQILAVYESGRPRACAPAIVWEPAAVLYDERATRHAAAVGAMDLTGRPKILVYGPYVCLPPGLWRAKIRFSVDDDAVGRRFRIDWGTQTEYAEERFVLKYSGVFEMQLDYRWTDVAPAEVRILVMEGCFSGAASFIGASVSLIEGPDDHWREAVEAQPEIHSGSH